MPLLLSIYIHQVGGHPGASWGIPGQRLLHLKAAQSVRRLAFCAGLSSAFQVLDKPPHSLVTAYAANANDVCSSPATL